MMHYMKKRILVFLFAAATTLQAVQIPAHRVHPPHATIQAPWFTGPLLAPSAYTIPQGHFNIEPYLYVIADTGKYDSHWHCHDIETIWPSYTQEFFQVGITPWLDFQISPTLFYNYTSGAGMWEFGDLPLGFDIQLFKRIRPLDEWSTAMLLTVKETIPSGKYQNLNPKKKGTDIGGQGSWQTTFELDWGNLFYIGHNRFITWRNSLQYTYPAPVHVKNLNSYGGSVGTNGTVYPAQTLSFDTAIEITLNQNWVFAMDFVGTWTTRSRFTGKTSVVNTAPASAQFSLAPAIEYNFSPEIGLIFGSWFTVAGRNSTQFTSAVIAFNYFH